MHNIEWSWRNQKVRGWIYQALVLGLLILLITVLVNNTLDNMRIRGIKSGFDFLTQSAGFDISENLINYQSSDPYWKAFLAGIGNTLRVAIIGIVLTTILGTLIGIGRFSHNALIRGFCRVYLEIIRNIPLLLQLLMWYLLFVTYLPNVNEADSFMGFYLSKTGLTFPFFSFDGGFHWSVPEKEGFAISGGVNLSAEFLSLLFGLTIYTATYISEIVRSGIMSVPRGQREAAQALGLSKGQIMRFIQLPQALRVIIPPLTNQYLNLTKNSSLAVAIAYPELVSIANTSLNQTGRAVECISIIMAVYLTLSLLTSAWMNFYNRQAVFKER